MSAPDEPAAEAGASKKKRKRSKEPRPAVATDGPQRRIKIIIEYDGTDFKGFQTQGEGVRTIQGELERAVTLLVGVPTSIHGASRTDAGVHAFHQICIFDCRYDIPGAEFARALNTRLPQDIAVRTSEVVDDHYEPHREAGRKVYRYAMLNAPFRSALLRRSTWHVPWRLETSVMVSVARQFEGTHCFEAFCTTGPKVPVDARGYVRTIYRSELTVTRDALSGAEHLLYEVEGDGFLYNQVRIMVGTLVDMGAGAIAPDSLGAIFESRDRARAGRGAPACGLVLQAIEERA